MRIQSSMFIVLPVGRRFKFNVHCSATRQEFQVQCLKFCHKAEIQVQCSLFCHKAGNSKFNVQCSARRQKFKVQCSLFCQKAEFKFSDSMLCQKAENTKFSDSMIQSSKFYSSVNRDKLQSLMSHSPANRKKIQRPHVLWLRQQVVESNSYVISLSTGRKIRSRGLQVHMMVYRTGYF